MGFDYAAKIRNLLEAADGQERSADRYAADDDHEHAEEFRAGAKSFRAKAEKLMVQYRIAEEEALATDEAASTPILRTVQITNEHTTPGMHVHYQRTFNVIARHCGVRHTYRWDGGYTAHVVGYDGDVRYAEFLWTSALLMFSTRIDPRWDADLSEAENIWRLRNAGIERRRIADQAWNNGRDAGARQKVQRIYVKECQRRGEPVRAAGLGYQTDTYRQAYAEGFHDTLSYRLRDARDAADSVAGGLVMHGRLERVDEAFYGHFPNLRPQPVKDQPAGEPCPNCAKAKSGHCRRHPAYTVTKADERRWDRMENSPSALAGKASGRHAAEGVVIARGHERANRLDASGRAIDN